MKGSAGRTHRLGVVTGMARAIQTKADAESKYGVRLSSRSLTPRGTKLSPDEWQFELTAGDNVPRRKRLQVKAFITGAQSRA